MDTASRLYIYSGARRKRRGKSVPQYLFYLEKEKEILPMKISLPQQTSTMSFASNISPPASRLQWSLKNWKERKKTIQKSYLVSRTSIFVTTSTLQTYHQVISTVILLQNNTILMFHYIKSYIYFHNLCLSLSTMYMNSR